MGWSLCQGGNGGGGSSGTPYLFSQQGAKIELPVYGDDDLIIKFKFLRTVIIPNTSYSCILGDVFDGNGVLLFYSGTHWEFFCGTGSHYTWTASYDDITDVEINTTTGSLKINGTTLYSQVGTRTHTPICLFTNSQFSYHYVGAIGQVEVYKDNDLYLNLVPMNDRQTDEGYYHDTIGNQDYYSTTSVPLIYSELDGNGGGGSYTPPNFSEDTILDNSAEASTFTFTSDYHNYDILRFKIHNADSGVYQYFFCTPNAIDYAFTLASRVTFNEYNTNQYATYSQSNLTWTRTNSRNIHVVECVGLACTNMSVNETEIYKAQSLTSSDIAVTYNDGLINEFDLIFVWANSSDYTEILPCRSIIHKVDFELENENTRVCAMLNYYDGYNVVSVTDTTMSSFRYFYVSGIKFT